MTRFKVGDKVVCIENPDALAKGKVLHPCYPGGGWIKDKIFKIAEISKYEDDNVYWPVGGGNGIWGKFLRLDSPFREGDVVALQGNNFLITPGMKIEDDNAVLISRKCLI